MGDKGVVEDPNDWKRWVVETPGIESAARRAARVALTDAVFSSTSGIASGGISCLLIGFTTAWRCASIVPIFLTLLYMLVVAWRLTLNNAYARERDVCRDHDRWALRYAIGALISSAMLGAAAGVAIALDLPTALLVGLAAIGSAGGIAGRNSAMPRLAMAQSALLIAPVAVAGFWSDEPANMVLLPTAIGFAYALFSFIRHHYAETAALIVARLDDAALARNDLLTGIANRRLFDERLSALWPPGRTAREPLALLLIDIDHFRRYNDLYGHAAGDDCLRLISAALRDLLQADELIARYGGGEFAVLLPECSLERAIAVADRFCRTVVALGIEQAMRTDELEVVTISVGIGASSAAVSAEHLIEAADRSLYRAKRAGGNRVYPEPAQPPVPLPHDKTAAAGPAAARPRSSRCG